MVRICAVFVLLFAASALRGQTIANDSTKNGTYLFLRNDSLLVRGFFRSSKRHKIWIWYNPDATIQKQVKYKHGRPLWTIYYENNKVWLKITRHGKRRIIRACDCREPGY